MYSRLVRDVISFMPDLVIINASLNWSEKNENSDYNKYLRLIIEKIQRDSQAEIVLMTPNGINMDNIEKNKLCERISYIRKYANDNNIALVDVYKIWESVTGQENIDIELTLANQKNHPTPLGNTLIAQGLMQLFTEE